MEASPVLIIISPGGTVPAGDENLQLANGVGVSFKNTAVFAVNLVFTSQFGTINVPPGQTSTSISTPTVTLNYAIYNASTNQLTGGPYSVQWGGGPLTINVNGVNPTPKNAAVGVGGKILFVSNADDMIDWTSAGSSVTVWAPQPGEITTAPNPVQTARPGVHQGVDYTLTSTLEKSGGGTVKIGS